MGEASTKPSEKELTLENVDRVLNEIRGYLFADGGDIEVVDVHDSNVFVRFQVRTHTRHTRACLLQFQDLQRMSREPARS